MKMADWFPELSETDLTSLVDQKNSENTLKAKVVELQNNLVITKYCD